MDEKFRDASIQYNSGDRKEKETPHCSSPSMHLEIKLDLISSDSAKSIGTRHLQENLHEGNLKEMTLSRKACLIKSKANDAFAQYFRRILKIGMHYRSDEKDLSDENEFGDAIV